MMQSEAVLTQVLELAALVQNLDEKQRQQDRTIAGIQHYLKIAADYVNDDPEKVVQAIQAALGMAAKYQGRNNSRKGRKR